LPWIGSNPASQGTAASNALAPLHELLPPDAASIVDRELASLQERPPTGIVSFGLIGLLWLSSSLFTAIMDAMNRIMGVQETRPVLEGSAHRHALDLEPGRDLDRRLRLDSGLASDSQMAGLESEPGLPPLLPRSSTSARFSS